MVEAPLVQAQLIETPILNIINFQTLIATKASRIKQVVGKGVLSEFGSRRAHDFDAAIWGTRAAYIGGFDSTSTSGLKIFGIPVPARAPIRLSSHRDEYTAFHKYAERHKDCIFLVDTYGLRSGCRMRSAWPKNWGIRSTSSVFVLTAGIWPTFQKSAQNAR